MTRERIISVNTLNCHMTANVLLLGVPFIIIEEVLSGSIGMRAGHIIQGMDIFMAKILMIR